jgi:hypothetical protein
MYKNNERFRAKVFAGQALRRWLPFMRLIDLDAAEKRAAT